MKRGSLHANKICCFRNIASEALDADVKTQAEDLRNNAVQLCGAGNTDEGLAVTAEAKVLLKVE